MAGHIYLFAAYAIAPFLIVSIVRFMQQPGARDAGESSVVTSRCIPIPAAKTNEKIRSGAPSGPR
jgi:hypothetical protein